MSFAAAGDAVLERLAAASRPLGLVRGRMTCGLLRRTYFDTREGGLAEQRLTLYWQIEADGREILRLTRLVAVNLQGIVAEEVREVPVLQGGVYATLAGDSEVATRVRDAVEVQALRPLLALDIDRETRLLRRRWLGRPGYRLHLDTVLAHAEGRSCTLHEAVVEELYPEQRPALEALASRLEETEGITQEGLDAVERARRLLAPPDVPPEEQPPQRVTVHLLVMRGRAVGLVPSPEGYVLPSAPGSGEDAAAQLLCGLVPGAEPELELVGFTPVRRSRTDIELWLQHGSVPDGGDGMSWVPVAELMERVGAPDLRASALVAALTLLAGSEVGRRLLGEAPRAPRQPPVLLDSLPPAAGRGAVREEFLDPELSILEFNARVLAMAEDARLPLLERLRFLAIFASNMDEFFAVRVGRLKSLVAGEGEAEVEDDEALARRELLDAIEARVRALMVREYACLARMLLPALAERGVRLRRWDELTAEERRSLRQRFLTEVMPLLTPRAMTVSPGHPFPRLRTLALSLAVALDPEGGAARLAHVGIPDGVPRFLAAAEHGAARDLVPVEDVIAANAAALFPSHEVVGAYPFRIVRQADVDIDEESSSSLLAAVADEVEARAYKPVVRIEVARSMPGGIRARLLRELRAERGVRFAPIGRSDVIEIDGPIDLRCLEELADLDLPGDRFPPFEPVRPLPARRSVFDLVRERDRLLFHPYESFDDTVGRLLDEAAADPAVLSIKLTLYRTGRDSPLMRALLRALAAGKEVAVFVELKARFDEEQNIEWTRRLREAGGHVVVGLVGFKTHAKTLLIVRRDDDGIRRYVHVGTGNYNASTARFYTDLGLLSCDPDLGADVGDLFNELTGSTVPPGHRFRLLWVAPSSMAESILRSIRREMEHARAGRAARIQAKLNGLSDRAVVRALYEASAAGVEVDLVVRSICTLRPGVAGLSDRVHVRSILGRFLEHARIYYFENAGAGEYWIGSADWRKRNLRRRVEVAVPVHDSEARSRLRTILDREMADPGAWILRPDGAYERLGGAGRTAQEAFMEEITGGAQ